MSRQAVDGLKKRMYDQHMKNTGVMPKREDLRLIEKKATDTAMRSDRRNGSKR